MSATKARWKAASMAAIAISRAKDLQLGAVEEEHTEIEGGDKRRKKRRERTDEMVKESLPPFCSRWCSRCPTARRWTS